MTDTGNRGNEGDRFRSGGTRFLGAAVAALVAITSCSKQSPPQKPLIHTTRAFDAVFGELPPLPIPGPCYATVGYFPSAREPEKFRPVPIFSVDQGKEEMLVVRTVIRGFETGAAPLEPFLAEIVHPFPPGADLVSLTYDGGTARVEVGGSFRAESLSAVQKEKAAKALALTVSQFGKADRVEVTGKGGTEKFGAAAGNGDVMDIGPPEAIGLLAIGEEKDQPPGVLSVLFDRPVFVEEASFYPAGGDKAVTGKIYSTGFGMTLELHPEPKISIDPATAYRVRLAVRDGKGRKSGVEKEWLPKAVVRH